MYHRVAHARTSVSFPDHQNEHTASGVLTASALLKHRGIDPATILRGSSAAIICFQRRTLVSLTKKFGGKPITVLSGETVWLRKYGILVAMPRGVGAPALAVTMEELAACGIRTMIAVGIAGTIDETGSAGNIIVPSTAIRDDGTSHHYLPSDLPARPAQDLVHRLIASLGSRSMKYTSGTVWTTDAPFRETADEIREYRDQGVLAVDMECATLFSVAQALGLRSACGLVISDSVAGGVWRPAQDHRAVDDVLGELSIAAVEALI